MQIAVIVSDASGMVHAGLDTERTVRIFELPEEISNYIDSKSGEYVSISFSLVEAAALARKEGW